MILIYITGMPEQYGPHLIDFYDLPPRAPGDRTPRIIGRLMEAGAAVRNAFPMPEDGKQEPYIYSVDPSHDFKIKAENQPLPVNTLGIGLIVRELSGYALPRYGLRNGKPMFGITVYNPDIEGPLVSRWHRDRPVEDAEAVDFLVGDENPLANTEYSTTPVAVGLLPFGFDGTDAALKCDDRKITTFLRNANAIAQIGSNEILEMFGDTPHRSSLARTGLRRFTGYSFNS